MKPDACSIVIIRFLQKNGAVCIDDLICENLITDFSETVIIKSLDWLVGNGLICCNEATKKEHAPYILVLGGVEYSTAEWRLSGLDTMVNWEHGSV